MRVSLHASAGLEQWSSTLQRTVTVGYLINNVQPVVVQTSHWRGRCFREIESVSYVTGVLRRTRHNGFPVVHGDGADPERDEGEFDELGCGASRTGPLEGVILRSQLLVLLGSQARAWPAPALRVEQPAWSFTAFAQGLQAGFRSGALESHGRRRAETLNPKIQAPCWARGRPATRHARRCRRSPNPNVQTLSWARRRSATRRARRCRRSRRGDAWRRSWSWTAGCACSSGTASRRRAPAQAPDLGQAAM